MKLHRVGGAVGFVVLLGACEVHVGSAPSTAGAPPPPPPGNVAAAHPPPPPPPPSQGTPPPASNTTPASTTPTQSSPPPKPGPGPMRFSVRLVHPPPLDNAGASHLDTKGLQAMVLRLSPGRQCGPRQIASGHWIHLDCNVHGAIASAKPPSVRKMHLMMAGGLRLDAAVGGPQHAGSSNVGAALPDAVDHRKDGTEGPIKDQGQVGSCTSFSLSSAMDNGIRRQNSPDTMSSIHIWSHYGYPAMASAGDATVKKPITLWVNWPYDEREACEMDTGGGNDCGPYSPPVTPGGASSDAKVQAQIKTADAQGQWQVSEYDEIQNDPDTIAAMLATGADVWFSMNIGNSWMNPVGDTISDWNNQSIDGGHAVLFAGYRHKNGTRQFLVHNSWGPTWGDGGYAYISEAMVKGFIKHAYKVVVVNGSQPPPPPNNQNSLTDDDCGEDQLVDAVTGQCATICPDDSRPANGQCVPPTSGSKTGHGPPPPPPPPPPPHLQFKPH